MANDPGGPDLKRDAENLLVAAGRLFTSLGEAAVKGAEQVRDSLVASVQPAPGPKQAAQAADDPNHLRSCPFCHSGGAIVTTGPNVPGVHMRTEYWHVLCQVCNATGPAVFSPEPIGPYIPTDTALEIGRIAAKLWNDRSQT